MIVDLVKQYHFEAAHQLPRVPPGHKCARLHGHSYVVELTVRGAVDPATGWLVDFGVLDELMAPIVAQLDHHLLNDLDGLENPTSEMLARWLWLRVAPALPSLAAVAVSETRSARCVYRGE